MIRCSMPPTCCSTMAGPRPATWSSMPTVTIVEAAAGALPDAAARARGLCRSRVPEPALARAPPRPGGPCRPARAGQRGDAVDVARDDVSATCSASSPATSRPMRRSHTSRCCAAATRPSASSTTSTTTSGPPLRESRRDERADRCGRARGGIALTLLPVLYTAGGVGTPPEPEQRRFTIGGTSTCRCSPRSTCARSRPAHARRCGAAQPAAPFARELGALLARRSSGPVHIHAAERTEEIAEVAAGLGARPVEWLLEHTGIDERWCVIHATHMTESSAQSSREAARSRACAR